MIFSSPRAASSVRAASTDGPGRDATARAVENAARAKTSPAIYVANTDGTASKDPDALVREHGIDAWRELVASRECGIVWRVKEMVQHVGRDAPTSPRREALGQAGKWLGTLPARLALEVE